MNLKHQIYSDIAKCQEVINAEDEIRSKDLVVEIANLYCNHIKEIQTGLSTYGYGDVDYLKDIHLLKRKLEILASEVKSGRNTNKPNKSVFVLKNTNFNSNMSTNSNELTIDIEINFEQIKNEIINNNSLTSGETKEILEKINQMEDISKSKEPKKEKWRKLKPLLNWLATKGVDIAIKLLPVITSIIKDS